MRSAVDNITFNKSRIKICFHCLLCHEQEEFCHFLPQCVAFTSCQRFKEAEFWKSRCNLIVPWLKNEFLDFPLYYVCIWVGILVNFDLKRSDLCLYVFTLNASLVLKLVYIFQPNTKSTYIISNQNELWKQS